MACTDKDQAYYGRPSSWSASLDKIIFGNEEENLEKQLFFVSGGVLTMIFVIVISMVPPANLKVGSPAFYTAFQLLGLLIFLIIPIIIYARRKPSWKTDNTDNDINN